ncbi:metallophosphatase [Myroides sp. JBRI-B21084]|uniref:bifunctional metallophosphatase/5'-nucleotidase n=1 Tax=Myroides sp. JBRI-B21084 TaxID=3119977 RepID=UPI0026E49234|nr:metallophosphatase [Paenimyroides cloacae]WKW45759.1 metallophosphatase [Paenimyroides cloacae]
MKRRDFILKTSATTALTLSGFGLSSFTSGKSKRITILHTNDTHSHLDPFDSSDDKFPNQGGAAKRATIFKKIKSENPNTLIFDAGDMFQGTPYFNYYGGALEIKIMNMLQYDAGTIGNHEFDNGVNNLADQISNAKFDILNANYDFTNTLMNGFTKPYKVFIKDGIKIGVFGLGVKLDGLVNKSEFGETVWNNPIEIAQDITKTLKNDLKCDLIICLSHLGYSYPNNSQMISDLDLAAQTKNIDLIIGGHTHTFLEEPTVVLNSQGNEVIVNQVGCYGVRVGQIDFYFDAFNQKTATSKLIKV